MKKAMLYGIGLFLGCCVFVNIAFADIVVSVNAKGLLVTVDEEFEVGAKVCFFKSNGKKGSCGTVQSSESGKSVIKVKKKAIKGIKKAMTVKLAEGTAVATGETEASETATTRVTRVKMNYVYTISSPSTYSIIQYEATELADGKPWKEYTKETGTMAGFLLAFELPIGKTLAVSPGFRYRKFDKQLLQADYISRVRDPYLETAHEMTSMGLFTDVYFWETKLFSKLLIRPYSGLDIDMSSLTFTATRRSESGTVDKELITASSKSLKVVSLRLGSEFDIPLFSIIGLNFNVNLLVPAFVSAGSFSAEFSSDVTAPENKEEVLKEALNHTKASFGAEIIMGAHAAF